MISWIPAGVYPVPDTGQEWPLCYDKKYFKSEIKG